jgi:flagellar basal-body rod protein FlgG
MAAQQQRIDAVSNDVANVSTAGYKGTKLAFRDLAYREAETGNGVRAGAGAAAMDVGRTQRAGAIETTGQPLDVAISGDGYLQVRRTDGSTGLTRQGALRLNAERQLTTAAGDRIEPAITIPEDVQVTDLAIGADGQITAAGRTLGQLALRTVPASAQLRPVGDSVFVATNASGALRPAPGAKIQQGALERSNVDMADSMVDLMEAQKAYTLASRAVQTQDQLLEIANQVRR